MDNSALRSTPDLQRFEKSIAAQLPRLMIEVGDLLRMDWPEYAEFLDENGLNVAEAAGLFVHRLVEMTERSLAKLEPESLETEPTVQLVFEQIGRTQWV